MTQHQIELIGLAAGTCTTLAFLPQVIKTWRSRSVRDLSAVMLVVFCTGVALWLAYGILIRSVPVIIANTATLVLSSVLVAFKLADTKKDR